MCGGRRLLRLSTRCSGQSAYGSGVDPRPADILLVVPPVAKACEPPAGIARLAAALQARGLSCRLLDANLEGLLWLLEQPPVVGDTWTSRAFRHRADHLAALRDATTYRSPARYRRAVSDLNRILAVSSLHRDAVVGLSDYRHASLSPVRSADLIAAASRPRDNPFHPYFSRRLPESARRRRHGRLLPQLPQPGALHLCDDRLRQKAAPGGENRPRRRPGDLLDAATRLAQSLRRPGGRPDRGSGGGPPGGPARRRSGSGSSRPARLLLPAAAGVSLARADPPLQRRRGLLVEPLHLLPGASRGQRLSAASRRTRCWPTCGS